jgi:nucleotide-sensitive chloride channel 1A
MATGFITSLPELVELAKAQQPGVRDAMPLGAQVLRYHQKDVQVRLIPEPQQPLSKGDLYVTEARLIFFSEADQRGFMLEYPDIGMHAISRQETNDLPCIYCQVDGRLEEPHANTEAQDEGNESDEEEALTEIRFIPDNYQTLDAVFEAISTCAALHPDRDLMSQDGDDDAVIDGQYNDAELDPEELDELSRAAMDYLDSIVDTPLPEQLDEGQDESEGSEGQFNDADEELN